MTDCTPRELRIIADHVERLTKARVVNQQLGVATTPDTVTVDFPNGFTGVIRWTPAQRSPNPTKHRALVNNTRHREAYHLDPMSLEHTGSVHRGIHPVPPLSTPESRATAALTALHAGSQAQDARQRHQA
ncbi:hypothetical protein AB0D56_36115 [Streptomyces sp. NPDC048209]|uniref:hypothetical protein n=1 Tax=Streptomyces sp. NPDC048209 TaxID=3156689 RepID=UPI0034478711